MFSILIGIALKSTVVLGVAGLLAFVLRGRSAAARHLVWTAAAAAVLALPFLSVSLPVLPVPASTGVVFQALASASGDGAVAPSAIARGGAAARGTPAAWRPDWRMILMLLWAAGAAIAFAQMLVACVTIWRLRRSARPFRDLDLCNALSQALGMRRTVNVLETKTGSMPMTFGILRSAIFMPSDAAQWSDERRRVVLLHELAHVRRGDVAAHLLARAALSLYWWNPLAWIAWREFLKERERATDDLVLNAGARASEYASHLLQVARSMQSSTAMGWAAVAMARRSQLEGRLLAILDTRIARKAPGRAAAFVASLLAIALVAPFAAVQAQDSKPQGVPADVDAAIRAANSQKNHEMLESAAKAAEQLRQYDTAQKLLESAVAIRADVSGEKSVAYGVGLLKLGDLEQRRHQTKSAAEFYRKAADVLGDRPEAARALIAMGIEAVVNKDFKQAAEYFQRAQRVDPDHAAPALMWLAIVRQREQNMDEADRLYRSALASQDPSETAITMRVYAQFLRKQGRTDEAGELDARVAAMRKSNVAQAKQQGTKSADVYRIGGGVTAPSLLQKVEPQYSDEARVAALTGSVMVYVEVGTDGLAHNIRVVQGLGLGLDENAVDAISQWRFQPGTKDGAPVTVAANIEVNFRLM